MAHEAAQAKNAATRSRLVAAFVLTVSDLEIDRKICWNGQPGKSGNFTHVAWLLFLIQSFVYKLLIRLSIKLFIHDGLDIALLKIE